ncbi:MAG: hypothetical protein NXH75_14110, partial [Halobacteriovoraceae bacterium]|nr:hypothetical protein [Halobacteriovoraceae bacterium]
FLYNMDPGYSDAIIGDFRNKVDEFMSWYSNFQNQEPIEYLELLTVDVRCENNCRFSPMERFSAVDTIISREIVREVLEEVGEKYKMELQLKV